MAIEGVSGERLDDRDIARGFICLMALGSLKTSSRGTFGILSVDEHIARRSNGVRLTI